VVRRRGDEADAGLRVTERCDLGADLVAGELTALTRLRSLGDLDLQLVCEREVLGRDAEASGRNLLDARVSLRAEAGRILAALAAVRPRAEAVERDRHGLVRFRRQRAV